MCCKNFTHFLKEIMTIQHSDDDKEGAFFIEENGLRIGELTYIFSGEAKFIIDHTEVSPRFEGKGVGKQLVKAAVEYARENSFKILPVCSYANQVLKETHGYEDVLV